MLAFEYILLSWKQIRTIVVKLDIIWIIVVVDLFVIKCFYLQFFL